MSNKVYDVLKFTALVIFPAVTACTGTILKALNVPCSDVVAIIMTAIDTCFGTIISKLSSDYKKKNQI